MKLLSYILASPLIFSLLISCEGGDSRPPDSMEIIMELPASDIYGDESVPNQIVIYDAFQERIIDKYGVTEGTNSIFVPRGGFYILGLTYNPVELSGSLLASAGKSISGGIRLLGNISIITSGLDSLPVSDSGGDELDVGALTLEGESFVSEIGINNTAENTGVSGDDLESLGVVDNQVLKYSTPDIDGNGQYDFDENFTWKFIAIREYRISFSTFDYDPDTVNDSFLIELNHSGLQYSLSTSRNYSYLYEGEGIGPGSSEVTMSYPVGDFRETVECAYSGGDSFYFRAGISPDQPYAGDYIFTIGEEDTYYINNVSFFEPSTYYEGFIFPLTKVTVNPDGWITDLYWRWKKIEGGSVVGATALEVLFWVKSMHFSWEKKTIAGSPYTVSTETYWENGHIDLVSGDNPRNININDTGEFFIDYSDNGGNYYKARFVE